MCGIAGLISQDPEARIGAMLKAVEHRGRDDEGIWTSPAINGEKPQVWTSAIFGNADTLVGLGTHP